MENAREAALMQQIAARDARIAELAKEKKLLQERIDQLLRKIYGAKSEKADLFQLQLLMQELHSPGPALGKGSNPEASEIAPLARKKISRQNRGPRLPEDLPVIEEILVPDVVQASPEAYRRIGEEV